MLKLYMLGLVRLDLVRFDGILFCFSQADSCSKGVILDMVVPAAMPTPWRQILRFMVQLSSLMLNKASWAWSWLIRLGFYYITVTKARLKRSYLQPGRHPVGRSWGSWQRWARRWRRGPPGPPWSPPRSRGRTGSSREATGRTRQRWNYKL